jgi:hypothetical protein
VDEEGCLVLYATVVLMPSPFPNSAPPEPHSLTSSVTNSLNSAPIARPSAILPHATSGEGTCWKPM